MGEARTTMELVVSAWARGENTFTAPLKLYSLPSTFSQLEFLERSSTTEGCFPNLCPMHWPEKSDQDSFEVCCKSFSRILYSNVLEMNPPTSESNQTACKQKDFKATIYDFLKTRRRKLASKQAFPSVHLALLQWISAGSRIGRKYASHALAVLQLQSLYISKTMPSYDSMQLTQTVLTQTVSSNGFLYAPR
jgi:hypothetical protein